MSAKGYTTKVDVEAYMGKAVPSTATAFIDVWIESVEQMIEKITDRVFKADATASERVYDGQGGVRQKFDEFVIDSETTPGVTIKLGEEEPRTTVAAGDFRIYPNNQENKNTIDLKSATFNLGNQNVRITAKWGAYKAVPADIKLAATIIVAGLVNNSSPDKGAMRSESFGAYSVTYATEKGWGDFNNAKQIVAARKRFTF